MKWLESRILWGALLILGGLLFLLQNLNVLKVANLFWAIVFGVTGIYLLAYFFSNRANWWTLIPGVILIDLALINASGVIVPGFASRWSGPAILAGISLCFWLIFLQNRDFWWVIIPGGVLLTLAGVSFIHSFDTSIDTGGIFFLGLGLTFTLIGVWQVPGDRQPYPLDLQWAFVPAGIFILLGLLISALKASAFNYVWPAILILLGLYLIYRTFLSRRV
ncbi:MAG: hypothetical protein ACM3PY_10640 [Omnitrophica WOR_2 bacterium]